MRVRLVEKQVWQAEQGSRHADILATILARKSARMSVSMSVSSPWNDSLYAVNVSIFLYDCLSARASRKPRGWTSSIYVHVAP